MPETVKEAIEITKKGFDGLGNAMNLYNKVLDQFVPWEMYHTAIKEIERYREDYSFKSAELAGKVKSVLKSAKDSYDDATQQIYRWCLGAVNLLEAYLILFANMNSQHYEGQRGLLFKVLKDAIIRMKNGEDITLECLAHFKTASGLLTSLCSRLNDEFYSDSDYFNDKTDKLRKEAYGGVVSGGIIGPFALVTSYAIAAGDLEEKIIPEFKGKLEQVKKFFSELKTTIDKTYDDISDMITKLQDEMKNIKKLKIQTEATKPLIPLDDLEALRDTITKFVNNIISQCNEYQKRHGKKN